MEQKNLKNNNVTINIKQTDIDYMLKCRAIFIFSFGCLVDDLISVDNEFNYLIANFIEDNLETYFDSLSLMYYFYEDDNYRMCPYDDVNWYDKMFDYLDYFNYKNSIKIAKLYDDVGIENVDKLTILASQFYDYVVKLNSNYIFSRIKQ